MSGAAQGQSADGIRLATFAAPLSRDGPGLLLRDIASADDPQILAVQTIIDTANPDILILTDFDFDATGAALTSFSGQLGRPFPHLFALRPNTGLQTGLDLDGDGFAGDEHDAVGYGRFLGDGGLAILSHWPIDEAGVVDLSSVRWVDVPGAELPEQEGAPWPSAQTFETLPVSSTAHWIVPITVGPQTITLLASDATPPVFDGPEDFNGQRNRDELRLWEAVLDGAFGPVPAAPVLIGNLNLDPEDGDGIREAVEVLLARPDLQDPAPRSQGALVAADPEHTGDPSLDTVDWPDGRPGNLRVSYILPSTDLVVLDAGVVWPAPDDPDAALLGGDGLAAGPHRLVWVDVSP